VPPANGPSPASTSTREFPALRPHGPRSIHNLAPVTLDVRRIGPDRAASGHLVVQRSAFSTWASESGTPLCWIWLSAPANAAASAVLREFTSEISSVILLPAVFEMVDVLKPAKSDCTAA